MSDQPTRRTDITGGGPPGEGLELSITDTGAFEARYLKKELLGRGGMGEVFLCEDRSIGREVALKVIRAQHLGSAEHQVRFLREARVQGRLQHPAIVPIHELGRSPELGPYFIMKRVHGQTLRQVLNTLRDGAAPEYTRAKLLAAFRQLCLAIDYAHSHGVVHRDLKPSNVMLGDFGEVHVLDWGLAKWLDRDGLAPDLDATLGGAVMGTPGYMAPEQRASDAIDERTDIYALGAILYEILTLRPLAPRASDREEQPTAPMAASTDVTVVRDPTLAPELQAICAKATRTEAALRHRSVHELLEELDRYLEGDRDLELRRSLARVQAASATALVDRVLANAPEATDRDRAEAMREVSRALALDPDHLPARHALVRLLVNPPARLPEAVGKRIRESWLGLLQSGARAGVVIQVLLAALFLPLVLMMGVRDWVAALAFLGFHVLLTAGAALDGWVAVSTKPYTRPLHLFVAFLAATAASRLFGPLVFAPSLAAGFLSALMFHARKNEVPAMVALTVLGIIAPVGLEYAGILPRSYAFTGDAMLIHAQMAGLREVPSMLFLVIATIAAVLIPAINLWRVRGELDRAQAELAVRAWHLETLMEG